MMTEECKHEFQPSGEGIVSGLRYYTCVHCGLSKTQLPARATAPCTLPPTGWHCTQSAPAAFAAPCTLPPTGWHCTRGAGHDGPCAAVPYCLSCSGLSGNHDSNCAAAIPPGSQVDPNMALPHRRFEVERTASPEAVARVEAAVHARAVESLAAPPTRWQRLLAWIRLAFLK